MRSSSAASPKAARSARSVGRFTAFRTSGRSIVTVIRRPSRSRSTRTVGGAEPVGPGGVDGTAVDGAAGDDGAGGVDGTPVDGAAGVGSLIGALHPRRLP